MARAPTRAIIPGMTLAKSVRRHRAEADLPRIAQYELSLAKVDGAETAKRSGRTFEPASTAGDLDPVVVTGRVEARNGRLVRCCIRIGKKYRVSAFGYPMMMIVKDRGPVGSRRHAQYAHSQAALQIAGCTAK